MNRVLAILTSLVGLGCMLSGVFLIFQVGNNPETALPLIPISPSPLPPTAGALAGIQIQPPPRQANIPIMPVMPVMAEAPINQPQVAQLETLAPSPLPPSNTPTETLAPNVTPPTRTPVPFISPTPSASPTATPTLIPIMPTRLQIPSISLDAPIQAVWLKQVVIDGGVYSQWNVPDGRVVGWHETSAPIGQIGNTVLNGHHNVEGQVFGDLVKVEVGDAIHLEGRTGAGRDYIVVQTLLLAEEGRSAEQRLENARWLLPSHDERITLVTCWPPDGRSHRLVVIALPNELFKQAP